MKTTRLLLSALFLAGSARAALPVWPQPDASGVVKKAKDGAAKMKTPDAVVAGELPAAENSHLLELARRVVERGDVTLTAQEGQLAKYDAYACEEFGVFHVVVVAKAQTCAKVFQTGSTILISALEVVADLHSDGSRSIRGMKIFSGCASCGPDPSARMQTKLFPDSGVWIEEGRYTSSRQLGADDQMSLEEDLSMWDRTTVGTMALDDRCYDGSGRACR